MLDALLLLAHLLGLVYWVGADVAVFYGAGIAAQPSLSSDARQTLGSLTRWVDQFPRSAVPIVLVSGVAVAWRSGYATFDVAWVWATIAIAFAWITINLILHARNVAGQDLGSWPTVDVVLRSSVMVGIAVASLSVLAGNSTFATSWLALKLLLFSGAIACSLAVRFLFKPFRPALARVVAGTGSADDPAIMRRALAKTRVAVVGIWLCALTAALIGIWKPL